MENNDNKFKLISSYKPAGDQPFAINKIVEGINEGKQTSCTCTLLIGS